MSSSEKRSPGRPRFAGLFGLVSGVLDKEGGTMVARLFGNWRS